MTIVDRRAFLAGAAALSLSTVLARAASADERGTLRVAIAAEAGDLDLLTNASSLSSYTAVSDPLVRYGRDGALESALAESWTVAPDGTSTAFKLRQGVSFSDGTPFDAEAATFNLGVGWASWTSRGSACRTPTTRGSPGC